MAIPMRALTSFGWGQTFIREGEVRGSDEPVVIRNAAYFEAITVPTVEQATAAPGERRSVTRPKKEA